MQKHDTATSTLQSQKKKKKKTRIFKKTLKKTHKIKTKKNQMAVESRRGHLGHISDKGGTGSHLGDLGSQGAPKVI